MNSNQILLSAVSLFCLPVLFISSNNGVNIVDSSQQNQEPFSEVAQTKTIQLELTKEINNEDTYSDLLVSTPK